MFSDDKDDFAGQSLYEGNTDDDDVNGYDGEQNRTNNMAGQHETSMASSRHFAASIGVNPHRVQLMKASFFTDDGEEDGMDLTLGTAQVSSTQIFHPSSASDKGLLSSRAESHESPGGQSMVLRPGVAVAPAPHAQRSNWRMFVSEPRPDVLSVVSAQRCLMPLPAEQSITSGKLHVVSDAGLMFGRSFRVGWGHGWKLAHAGATVSSTSTPATVTGSRLMSGVSKATPSQQAYSVHIEQLHASPLCQKNVMAVKNRIINSMQIQLDHSNVSTEDDVPLITPIDGVNCLDAHATQAKAPEESMDEDSSSDFEYYSQVWSLMSALWGRLPASSSSTDVEETGM